MKKLSQLTLLIAINFFANAQTNQIVIGKIDSLQSNILGEKRKIWVHVPQNQNGGIYATQKYPVIYLLDGDAHFSSVVGMMGQLSAVNGNTICPEMIVVGIPNTNRMRDLSPTKITKDAYLDSTQVKITGGGENFLSFIEKELMPYIDSNYPTQPYKMLIGHSLGGLLAIQALIHHPKLFNAYIAIDPSMWWDNQKLLKEARKALVDKNFDSRALFLGIANTMDKGNDIIKVQKDTTENTRHIRSILKLRDYLALNKQNGLKVKSKFYPDDTHSSAVLITEYDAFRFIFDYYNLKLKGKDYADTTGLLAAKLDKHFANVSKQFGFKVAPSETLMNQLGYQALSAKHFRVAENIFKMNTINYPASFNVYDSYADYFITKKDTTNAIINLQKALKINNFPESRKKLEELQGNKK